MSTFLRGFEGYTRRPAAEYKAAVRGYLVSVDTNVLLELYRFTPEARSEFFEVLRKLGDRLWVPHHVVREFFNRRVDAVKEHLELYTTIPEALTSHKNKALDELNRFAKRCSLSPTDRLKLTEPIEKAFDAVAAEVTRRGNEFDLSLESMIADDHILSTLAQILDGKTGDPFTEEEESAALATFDKRASDKIPPGYKDSAKDTNAHGDYFVWEQLLRHAEAHHTPVLFVTNDAKEDWVRKQSGFIVGARPELIAEFSERCRSDFLLTQLGAFLRTAKEELGVVVSPSTVAQAENLEASRVTSRYSLQHDLYIKVMQTLAEEMDRAKGKNARSELSALMESLQDSATIRGSRIYLSVPTRSSDIFKTAVLRANYKDNEGSLQSGRNQEDEEKKLARVQRRYQSAVADYERSCAALEQTDGLENADAVLDVLLANKAAAADRMTVLARRITELGGSV